MKDRYNAFSKYSFSKLKLFIRFIWNHEKSINQSKINEKYFRISRKWPFPLVLTVSVQDAVIDVGEGQPAGGLGMSLVSADIGVNL